MEEKKTKPHDQYQFNLLCVPHNAFEENIYKVHFNR